jgi:hypothetical protein
MDCNETVLSTSIILDSIDPTNSLPICSVCGTKNVHLHYGALCCVSCKMFFRRNTQFDLVGERTDLTCKIFFCFYTSLE